MHSSDFMSIAVGVDALIGVSINEHSYCTIDA